MKSLPLRLIKHALLPVAQFAPGGRTLRHFLHMVRGVQFPDGWRNGFIAYDCILETEYPEVIEIHEGVEFGPRVTVIAHGRGAGKIIFEDYAFAGTGAIVQSSPGKTIVVGECAFIAAGAVVTQSVPPWTLVGGNPAKPLKTITVPYLKSTYNEFRDGLKSLDK